MLMFVEHVLTNILRPHICSILDHLIGDLGVILGHETVDALKVDLIQVTEILAHDHLNIDDICTAQQSFCFLLVHISISLE